MSSQSYQDRRKALAQIARETIARTPEIAAALPHLSPTVAERLNLGTLPPLNPKDCPGFKLAIDPKTCGTTVRVVGQDSFDAAISMTTAILGSPATADKQTTREMESARLAQLKTLSREPRNLGAAAPRVAVLNMASDKNPGGGWLGGAAAQEEALCFRSTLAASLDKRFYPIPPRAGLYTRDVVIFRKSMGDGHGLMVPDVPADELPLVSVLSVAGIRRPETKVVGGKTVFASQGDRDLTKDKMRLCLRMGAARGHAMLVLGALGCGAFRNPPADVADCWREVLGEQEFSGGWFKEIWFAVYDRKNDGNLPVFERVLGGLTV